MNGKSHLLMGAASAAPLLLITRDGMTLAVCAGLAMAGSLAPDIDQPKHALAISWPKRLGWMLTGRTARGGKKPPSFVVDLVFFKALYGVMRGTSWLVRRCSKLARQWATPHDKGAFRRSHDPDHRALTHTGAAALAAGVLVAVVSEPLYGVAVFAGWMSHILSDGCTVAGVPLWFPFKIRGRRWHPVRLMKRFELRSCGETDWRVAWLVVLLIATPTAALYPLIP